MSIFTPAVIKAFRVFAIALLGALAEATTGPIGAVVSLLLQFFS